MKAKTVLTVSLATAMLALGISPVWSDQSYPCNTTNGTGSPPGTKNTASGYYALPKKLPI